MIFVRSILSRCCVRARPSPTIPGLSTSIERHLVSFTQRSSLSLSLSHALLILHATPTHYPLSHPILTYYCMRRTLYPHPILSFRGRSPIKSIPARPFTASRNSVFFFPCPPPHYLPSSSSPPPLLLLRRFPQLPPRHILTCCKSQRAVAAVTVDRMIGLDGPALHLMIRVRIPKFKVVLPVE